MKLRNPFRRDQRVDLGAFPGNALTGLGYTETRGLDDPSCVSLWSHPKATRDIAVFEDGWVIPVNGEGFDWDGLDGRAWDAMAAVRPADASMLAPAPPGAKCTAELEGH